MSPAKTQQMFQRSCPSQKFEPCRSPAVLPVETDNDDDDDDDGDGDVVYDGDVDDGNYDDEVNNDDDEVDDDNVDCDDDDDGRAA